MQTDIYQTELFLCSCTVLFSWCYYDYETSGNVLFCHELNFSNEKHCDAAILSTPDVKIHRQILFWGFISNSTVASLLNRQWKPDLSTARQTKQKVCADVTCAARSGVSGHNQIRSIFQGCSCHVEIPDSKARDSIQQIVTLCGVCGVSRQQMYFPFVKFVSLPHS